VTQRRRVLVNLRERTQRNEASFIYEYEFDCLTERYVAHGARSYFSANGTGEVIREFVKDQRGMAGGFGVQAVQRELCANGLRDLAAQPPYAIGVWDLSLQSVLKCRLPVDKDGREFLARVRQRVKPLGKSEQAYTYAARGQMGGYEINMPVGGLVLGVCNASGEVACGAASFVGLKVDWPAEVTRERLRSYRRSGVDYTAEARDKDSGSTLRPVLVADPANPKGSLLYCDSGNL